MAVAVTNVLVSQSLAALVASGGPLDTVWVGLYCNNNPLDANTATGDLTAPTYTGYARKPVTWTAVYQRSDGTHAIQGNLMQFQMSDAATPTTVLGYGVYDALTAGNYLFGERFSDAKPLTTVTDAAILTVELSLPDMSVAAATVIV